MIARIAVIIPAANEEATIARCLSSVLAAAAAVSCPMRIIVVLDDCTDGTAREVARFPDVTSVVTSHRNVGHARRLGTDLAILEDEHPDELWLANTDADSCVPSDWLTAMLRLGGETDLLLGTVVPDAGLTPALESLWYSRHPLHDGHPHVHAANLGMRASAYLALGGWHPLRASEDVDLVDRAVTAGLRVHRTAGIAVHTSTRVIGRVPHGFSSYLRELGHA